MKNILKIARYDFKRIMFNPITYVGLIIVLVASIIAGFVIEIKPTATYSASISGKTTRQVFENFNSTSTSFDTKTSLNSILNDAQVYIDIQNDCYDEQDLHAINQRFSTIEAEVKKNSTPSESIYADDITEIKNASRAFKNFVDRFATLDAFESNLIFTKNQFETLTNTSEYFYEISYSTKSNDEILEDLYKNLDKFKDLHTIANSVYILECDKELLDNLQTQVIEKTSTQLSQIYTEMENVNNNLKTIGDISHLQDMTNLITNYKLKCESAKFVVETKLKLVLEQRFDRLKSLYHFDTIIIEDIQLDLVQATYNLDNDDLYYTQHQTALNFRIGSYEISMYDYTYSTICIIGFLTVLFGIFVTYKLFGRDRRNGKIDTILSQDVTFNQVFTAKFLAIVLITSTILVLFTISSLIWSALLYPSLPNSILTIFNSTSVYSIHPFLFLIIKLIGIELQVIFYSVITLFLMNISRKFNLTFVISISIFLIATVCNIFLNNSLAYCMFPFIHADLTSFLGGGTMQTGFLQTSIYTYGNFFISLAYYLVVVVMLYSFTKQLFRKN